MEQFRSSDFDAKKNPKLWFPGNEVFDVGRLPPHGLRFGADGAVSGAGTDRQGQHYNVAGKWDPDVVAMDAEAPTLTLTKTVIGLWKGRNRSRMCVSAGSSKVSRSESSFRTSQIVRGVALST